MAAPLTSVVGREAVVGALHEDDVVCLKHGLWGGVEVTVEPHVGVGAAVIADLDHARGVTEPPQSLGAAASLLPCKGQQMASRESPGLVQQHRTARASSETGGEITE